MVSPNSNGSHHTNGTSKPFVRTPLQYSGSLDGFKWFDVTTIIGREYPDIQLTGLMKAENSDKLLRDLAITSESLYLGLAQAAQVIDNHGSQSKPPRRCVFQGSGHRH